MNKNPYNSYPIGLERTFTSFPMNRTQKVIFHIDMDAFYASIEQRDNPEIRGKPVIVGALPGHRGVVSAASYEARTFGIHSAMPISQAVKLCPKGIFLRPRIQVYTNASRLFMEILSSYSPILEQISIDEAFIDMTGTGKLWGSPPVAARTIAMHIKQSMQLSVSIGIARNKFLAKLASDFNKPKGITLVPFDSLEIIQWLGPLDVGTIWGVGKRMDRCLQSQGIKKIADLQKLTKQTLKQMFGRQGISLFNLCRGVDTRDMVESVNPKSISREKTFDCDSFDPEQWHRTLLTLARDVAKRVRKSNQKGKTVFLTYRTPEFKRHSRHITFRTPTNLGKIIFSHAFALLEKEKPFLTGLRLIGLGITNFDETIQLELFEKQPQSMLWESSERAMDDITNKFGKHAIFLGGEKKKLTGRG